MKDNLQIFLRSLMDPFLIIKKLLELCKFSFKYCDRRIYDYKGFA